MNDRNEIIGFLLVVSGCFLAFMQLPAGVTDESQWYLWALILVVLGFFIVLVTLHRYQERDVPTLRFSHGDECYVRDYAMKGNYWYVITDGGEGRAGVWRIPYNRFLPGGEGAYHVDEFGKLRRPEL